MAAHFALEMKVSNGWVLTPLSHYRFNKKTMHELNIGNVVTSNGSDLLRRVDWASRQEAEQRKDRHYEI